MAKFAFECPHCSTLNTASTFIFAKKEIQCGNCKELLNVKQNRLTSKKCPHCKKLFLFDLAKERDNCPFCDRSIPKRMGSYVSIDCPECGCTHQVSPSQSEFTCPVCDNKIDVQKTIAKSKVVSEKGVNEIKYEGDNDIFVWKHPIEDFNIGSQVIVHESQQAIFLANGQVVQTFGPGVHTLENTEKLPLSKSAKGDAPHFFHAEIYFINKTVQMSIPWGTPDRVRFIDPDTNAPIDIGASGDMNIQVSDGVKLLTKLVGTTNGISWAGTQEYKEIARYEALDVTKDSLHHQKITVSKADQIKNSLRLYFKPLIKTTVKANLAQIIKQEKIDILEIDEKLDTISEALRAKLSTGFEEYGLTVSQFYVTNIALPDESDKNFQIIKKSHTETLQLREIELEKKMRLAKQAAEIEAQTGALSFDRIEAEKRRIAALGDADIKKINAEAEATRIRMEGLAKAEVAESFGVAKGRAMDAQGYTKKDEFERDAQIAWANGIGQAGQGGGNGGGGVMSDVISTGVAMATVGAVSEKMSEAMKTISTPKTSSDATQAATTPKASANTWKCACGNDNTGKFCSECGAPKPIPSVLWNCLTCDAKGNKGKFCSECGAPRPETGATISYANKDTTGEK